MRTREWYVRSSQGALAALLLGIGACAPESAPPPIAGGAAVDTDVPMRPAEANSLFIENVGQFDPQVRFMVRGGGEGAPPAWLTDDAIWMVASEPATAGGDGGRAVAMKLTFDGARSARRIVPFGRVTSTKVSYFIGDPSTWRGDVPLWAGVRYEELYPGVDLVVAADGGRWTPRIEARSEEARRAVNLRVDGAERVIVDGNAVRIETAIGALQLPFAGLTREPPAPTGGGATTGHITQPVGGFALTFSTFLGGTLDETGRAIAVSPDGAQAVTTGFTNSPDFPVTFGAFALGLAGNNDVYVSSFTSAGALLFSTYLGGVDHDRGFGVAYDAALNVYVTGGAGGGFPITMGAAYSGNGDAFVSKLRWDGAALTWSRYLGGMLNDAGRAIAVRGNEAYLTGIANNGFPVVGGSYDIGPNGLDDAFVTHLGPGGGLLYSTYLGGAADDRGYAIAVDDAGQAFVTGETFGGGFPYFSAGGMVFGPGYSGGGDAFVTKLNAGGTGLVYSGLLGGMNGEIGTGIALDMAGNVHVVGLSTGGGFPLVGALFGFGGATDPFLTHVHSSGSMLTFSTYLGGGAGIDVANALAVRNNEDYIAGGTASAMFFGMGCAVAVDAFVTRITAAPALGSVVCLGGANNDDAFGIAVAPDTHTWVTGVTNSPGFPVTFGAYAGGNDAFVTRF